MESIVQAAVNAMFIIVHYAFPLTLYLHAYKLAQTNIQGAHGIQLFVSEWPNLDDSVYLVHKIK